ncbi:MAG: hypothetical protein CL608_14020 [Anaerolineaceae bacterium]|nr:hypothetical protein [Anaerolineaceae bacterium]
MTMLGIIEFLIFIQEAKQLLLTINLFPQELALRCGWKRMSIKEVHGGTKEEITLLQKCGPECEWNYLAIMM